MLAGSREREASLSVGQILRRTTCFSGFDRAPDYQTYRLIISSSSSSTHPYPTTHHETRPPHRAIRTFPAAPPLATRRVAPPPEGPLAGLHSRNGTDHSGERQRRWAHADARARPSKKRDVSSDRIGRRLPPCAHVSGSSGQTEGGSTCAPARGPACPGPHVSRSPFKPSSPLPTISREEEQRHSSQQQQRRGVIFRSREKRKKMSGQDLQLPPGFRFHPTDEELVMHYLCRRCAGMPIAVPIIAEIDLYKFDPWQLPRMALYGEKEWYFFSPRDRKYPNGSRPNRAAGSGYWKATGADKPVGTPKPLAIKKALVFYAGKAPKGEKTNWIMHEYRLADVDRSARKKNSLREMGHARGAAPAAGATCRNDSVGSLMPWPPNHFPAARPATATATGTEAGRRCEHDALEMALSDQFQFIKQDLTLDDWVLCRIYNKKGGLEKPPPVAVDRKPAFAPPAGSPPEQKPFVAAPGGLPPAFADQLAAYYDRPSDSMPRLHADSSCSEQVLSPENHQFASCDREVQSQPKITEWERTFASDPVNPAGSTLDPVGGGHGGIGAGDPLLQDILMYWGKPVQAIGERNRAVWALTQASRQSGNETRVAPPGREM
ncbi:hypothetical protein HU200_067091 [Digitaria exilis]|uniref:NAC domain-containing protein n=1 Tax=Digitaria exilis TaxID=1010633 RepID=A0A835DWJ2_9POAL|nr:hypothetical protein HU200_067091 [Digitaria exilis]